MILTSDFTKRKSCYIFSEVLKKIKDRKILEKVSVASSVSFIGYLKQIRLIGLMKVKLNIVTKLCGWYNVERKTIDRLSQPFPCISL